MKTTKMLLALLALTTGLLAQNNPAPAPADAAKLALAREVIAAMHADRMFDGMMVQMKQMASQMAAESLPPNATPEQRQKFEALQGRIMDVSMTATKGLIAKMDQIYASVYSEAELNAMKAFFLSPEGQSMLAKQPQIMQHLMPLVQQMQRDLMPQVRQIVEQAKAEDAAATPAATAAPAPAPAPAK